MTYPASSYPEGVDLTIIAGNQLHEVINGDADQVVSTDGGDIPSVRKALADIGAFKPPINWVDGGVENDPFQVRLFTDGSYYWAPSATNTSNIPMGNTPVGDANWKLAPLASNATVSNTNLLVNHNFLNASPDSSVTPPSAATTPYVSGTQVFRGWYAGTSGVSLQRNNALVTIISGELYQDVPRNNGLEYIPNFIASVSDFDGKPVANNVSFSVVGDNFRVVVASGAVNIGSVKFEQGGIPTRHETGNDVQHIYNTVSDPSTNQAFTDAIGEQVTPKITEIVSEECDNRQKETTGLSDIVNAGVGLDIFPLIGSGIRVDGSILGVVTEFLSDGVTPLPNPAELISLPDASGRCKITGNVDVQILKSADIINGFAVAPVDKETLQLAINYAHSKKLKVLLNQDFELDINENLTLPDGVWFEGLGKIIGKTNGLRPTKDVIDSAIDRASAVALIEGHFKSTLTPVGEVYGNLKIKDILWSSRLVNRGVIDAESTAGLEEIQCIKGAVYDDQEYGVIVGSSGTGWFADMNGNFSVPNGGAMWSVGRNAVARFGSSFDLQNAYLTRSDGDDSLFMSFGAVGRMTNMRSTDNNGSITMNYLCSGDFESGISSRCASTSGVVVESSSSIFMPNSKSEQNAISGIFATRCSAVQAANAFLRDNVEFAVDARNNSSVDVKNAPVNTSNNSGGIQFRATGGASIITAEPSFYGMQGQSHFNPGYNRTGNGNSYIGGGTDDNSRETVGGNVFHITRESISAGSITPRSSMVIIDTESGNANDILNNITRDTENPIDFLIIQTEDPSRDITVKNNSGNLRTATQSDRILDNQNRMMTLVWNYEGSVYVEPGRYADL